MKKMGILPLTAGHVVFARRPTVRTMAHRSDPRHFQAEVRYPEMAPPSLRRLTLAPISYSAFSTPDVPK